MSIKRFLAIIIFLGSLAFEAKTDYKSNNYNHTPSFHPFSMVSSDKQIREMNQLYGAVLCSDRTLVQEFDTIQSKLCINPAIPLFMVQHAPTNLPKNTLAFYLPHLQTITIVSCNFYKQPVLERTHTLYHELRHHLQHTASHAYNSVLAFMALKHLSYKQALEYDADNFGVRNSTNNCPLCLKELQRNFSMNSSNNDGYFTQNDFTPILQEANKTPKFCSRHQSSHSAVKNFNKYITNSGLTAPITKHNSIKEYNYTIKLTLPILLYLGYLYRSEIRQYIQL